MWKEMARLHAGPRTTPCSESDDGGLCYLTLVEE
jgi:hypothetical protein